MSRLPCFTPFFFFLNQLVFVPYLGFRKKPTGLISALFLPPLSFFFFSLFSPFRPPRFDQAGLSTPSQTTPNEASIPSFPPFISLFPPHSPPSSVPFRPFSGEEARGGHGKTKNLHASPFLFLFLFSSLRKIAAAWRPIELLFFFFFSAPHLYLLPIRGGGRRPDDHFPLPSLPFFFFFFPFFLRLTAGFQWTKREELPARDRLPSSFSLFFVFHHIRMCKNK